MDARSSTSVPVEPVLVGKKPIPVDDEIGLGIGESDSCSNEN